jgi:hypothetical protein
MDYHRMADRQRDDHHVVVPEFHQAFENEERYSRASGRRLDARK